MTATVALLVLLSVLQRAGSSSCGARHGVGSYLDVTSCRKSACMCDVHAGDHVSNDHDIISPVQYGGSNDYGVSDDHRITSATANTSPLPSISPLRAAPARAPAALPMTNVYVVQWTSYYPAQEHAHLLSEAIGVSAPPCRHTRESATHERLGEPLGPRQSQEPWESPGLSPFCWKQRPRTNPATGTERFPSDFSTLELRTNLCWRRSCAEHRHPEVSDNHPGHCAESSARSSEAGDFCCGANQGVREDAGVAVDTSEVGIEAEKRYEEIENNCDSCGCPFRESGCADCCESLDCDFCGDSKQERAMHEAFLESLRGNPLVKSVHRDQASPVPCIITLHRFMTVFRTRLWWIFAAVIGAVVHGVVASALTKRLRSASVIMCFHFPSSSFSQRIMSGPEGWRCSALKPTLCCQSVGQDSVSFMIVSEGSHTPSFSGPFSLLPTVAAVHSLL